MKIPHAVSEGFSERLVAFLDEAYSQPMYGLAVGGYVANDPRPTRVAAAKFHGYIRKLRRGDIEQPSLERAWNVGAAIMRLSREAWANPVVMLFVCGYYGHVAHLLTHTEHPELSVRTLAEMARALQTVPFAEQAKSVAEARQDLVREGFDELVAHAAAAQYQAMPAQRPDRKLWEISVRQYAAFLTTWNEIAKEGLDMKHPMIATCQFIAERAEYAIPLRDVLVCQMIRGGLRAAIRP